MMSHEPRGRAAATWSSDLNLPTYTNQHYEETLRADEDDDATITEASIEEGPLFPNLTARNSPIIKRTHMASSNMSRPSHLPTFGGLSTLGSPPKEEVDSEKFSTLDEIYPDLPSKAQLRQNMNLQVLPATPYIPEPGLDLEGIMSEWQAHGGPPGWWSGKGSEFITDSFAVERRWDGYQMKGKRRVYLPIERVDFYPFFKYIDEVPPVYNDRIVRAPCPDSQIPKLTKRKREEAEDEEGSEAYLRA